MSDQYVLPHTPEKNEKQNTETQEVKQQVAKAFLLNENKAQTELLETINSKLDILISKSNGGTI